MIITLTGANFASKNINGALTTWYVSYVLGTGATYSGPTSIDKDASLSATVTIADGYEIGSAGVTVTMGGTDVTSTVATISEDGLTVTISISAVTGNVKISVPTVNTSTGEEDDGSSDESSISGYTLQTLSYDESAWYRSTVGESGIGTDGSSSKRLSYATAFTIPDSQRIMVTCADGYQWGVRNGSSTTSLPKNQYWLNSGDELQLAYTPSGGQMYLILRKTNNTASTPFGSTGDTESETITKSEISTIQPALYFKDTYSAEFDTSDYELVETVDSTADNWYLATVSSSGIGADGSSSTRLAYSAPFDATKLANQDSILITCGEGYQFGIRISTDGGSTYAINHYWYNPGTAIRFSAGGTATCTAGTATNYWPVFRKAVAYNGATASSNDATVTKDDVANLNVRIYTAKSYS